MPLLCVAVALGVVLALAVLKMAPGMRSWSTYMVVLFSMMALASLATLVLGDVRRVLLLSLVLSVSLNLAFSPMGEVDYHAGGASAGLVLYPFDFPLVALTGLWLLDALGSRKPIHFYSIDVAAILLIIWSTLSVINSLDIQLSVFELLRMTKLYLLSRVVVSNVRRRRDVRDVLVALLIGLLLQSGIAVLQYTVGLDFGLGLYAVGDLNRVSGLIGWPNTLGAYAATVVSVAFALWMSDADRRLGLLVRVACIAGFFPLILSFSRGAWISVLPGVAIGIFLGWRTGWLGTRSLVRLVVIALSFAVVASLFAGSMSVRLMEVDPSMSVVVDRVKLNQVALSMIKAHPLLGVGINTFVDAMGPYDATGVTHYFTEPVHNVYLLVAAETGLVGLGLFLLLMLAAFREGLRAVRTNDRLLSACAIGVLSGLVVLAVSNLADAHLRTDVLYALFWLLIGLIAAIRRIGILASPSEGHDQNVVARSQVTAINPVARFQQDLLSLGAERLS